MSYRVKATLIIAIAVLVFGVAYVYFGTSLGNTKEGRASQPLHLSGQFNSGDGFQGEKEALGLGATLDAEPVELGENSNTKLYNSGSEFMASRGYVNSGALEMYKSYDVPTLTAMGDNGDLIALAALADKYNGTNTWVLGIAVWEKAAMFGATNTAVALGGWNISQSKVYENIDQTLSHQALVEGLAWYEFVRLRGGNPFLDAQRQSLTEENLSLLDPDILSEASQRGAEIYARLESQRIARGLEPFDNAIPESAKPFLKLLEGN